MTPEFSRPERLDEIGTEARTIRVVAGQPEREALARRFDLIAVRKLEGTFVVVREGADTGGGVLVTGRVAATVTQACAVSGEPLKAAIDEPVTLRFVAEVAREEEIELDGDAIDTLPIEGDAIDLGEAAAETLALAIDPFLRAAGASEALADAGAAERAKTGPFAGLKGLLPG